VGSSGGIREYHCTRITCDIPLAGIGCGGLSLADFFGDDDGGSAATAPPPPLVVVIVALVVVQLLFFVLPSALHGDDTSGTSGAGALCA